MLTATLKWFGGKANNLFKMEEKGISVPKTWVISNNYPLFLYKQYNIESNDIESVKYFLDNLPKKVYRELFEEVSDFIKNNREIKRFAVRSSQTYEDGKENSFSGLFYTGLNISKTGDITDEIIRCWKESYNDGVIEYSKRVSDFNVVPCSVIIQQFIQSEKSGVVFRWNDKIIIDSNFGLAKSIVDGETGCDELIIDDLTKQIISYTNNKSYAIIPINSRVNPNNGDIVQYNNLSNLQIAEFDNTTSTLKVKLDEESKKMEVLEEQEIGELLNTCEKVSQELDIENYDVEWTFYEKKLYILQCRPLTKPITVNKLNSEKNLGIGLVSGEATGIAVKVENEKDLKKLPDKNFILITKKLYGSTILAANKATGCMLQSKSPLSHSAIIAREIGIPVIGAVNLDTIVEGEFYYINGETGDYKIVDMVENSNEKGLSNTRLEKVDVSDFDEYFDYSINL